MTTTSTKEVAKKDPIKLPKTLAACADLYYQKREERLLADKAAAALKSQETFLAEHLIKNLPKSEATGVAGKVARVFVENKDDYRPKNAESWKAIWEYIFKNKAKGSAALLQRRLSPDAVKEIMESGKPIPGVEKFSYPVLRYSKL